MKETKIPLLEFFIKTLRARASLGDFDSLEGGFEIIAKPAFPPFKSRRLQNTAVC